MTDLHKHYDQLDAEDHAVIDNVFRGLFNTYKEVRGISLMGNDRCEEAVDAVAKWILLSKQSA